MVDPACLPPETGEVGAGCVQVHLGRVNSVTEPNLASREKVFVVLTEYLAGIETL